MKYLPKLLDATARFTAASATESRCHGAVLFDVIFLLFSNTSWELTS
jgi:hypothetical protein